MEELAEGALMILVERPPRRVGSFSRDQTCNVRLDLRMPVIVDLQMASERLKLHDAGLVLRHAAIAQAATEVSGRRDLRRLLNHGCALPESTTTQCSSPSSSVSDQPFNFPIGSSRTVRIVDSNESLVNGFSMKAASGGRGSWRPSISVA